MEKVIRQTKPNKTVVRVPSSKSLTHRALITASLAEGTSLIRSVFMSEDIMATIRCMEKLGVVFEKKGEDLVVHGIGSVDHYDGTVVDCGESGSTLRFLIPLFSLCNREVKFMGHGRLMERPQSVYEELFLKRKLRFERNDDTLVLEGALTGGTYVVDGSVSSQFISGLLFALPLMEEDSVIEIREPFESSSYVKLTVEALHRAGIEIRQEGLKYFIRGKQKYQPYTCEIAGDDSQAAFFVEEALVTQCEKDILNIDHDSKQADHVVFEIAERMGAEVIEIENGYRIVPHQLKSTVIDLADCVDLGPALFATATQCEGVTVFVNAERLRIKESDRIACMEEELRKLGCKISSDHGVVSVEGKTVIRGNVEVDGHHDHRIVMALTMLALISDGPVTIKGTEAVNKSYPTFFTDLVETGADIR